MVSEELLRQMVDWRIRITVDLPSLREESGNQENWGYVESFDDETLVVKLVEGVYDFWVFPVGIVSFVRDLQPTDRLLFRGDTPGWNCAAVRGPNSRDRIQETKAIVAGRGEWARTSTTE